MDTITKITHNLIPAARLCKDILTFHPKILGQTHIAAEAPIIHNIFEKNIHIPMIGMKTIVIKLMKAIIDSMHI